VIPPIITALDVLVGTDPSTQRASSALDLDCFREACFSSTLKAGLGAVGFGALIVEDVPGRPSMKCVGAWRDEKAMESTQRTAR